MRSRDLQLEFAETFRGRSVSDIDQRFRALRDVMSEARGERQAPRGINAPHLFPTDVAAHVLTLVPRRPGDLNEVLPRLSQCCCIAHPVLPEDLAAAGGDGGLIELPAAGASIRQAVVDAVADYRSGWHNFEIAEDGDLAWLTYRDSASPFGIKLLFAVDHQKVAASIREQAQDLVERKKVDPQAAQLIAYNELDQNTRGSRFVVNSADLFWMGMRATMQHPELRDDVEAAQRPAARLGFEIEKLTKFVKSTSRAMADGRLKLSREEAAQFHAWIGGMTGQLLAIKAKLQDVAGEEDGDE